MQEIIGHNRHHYVQFKVAGGAAPGYGGIVADHLRADHEHTLRDHRIDLSRHNARARLHFGQAQLAEAAARAGAEPADVVGNFGERYGVGLERSAEEDHGVARALRLKMTRRFHEREARDLSDLLDYSLGESRRRIQTGPNGCTAQRELVNSFES